MARNNYFRDLVGEPAQEGLDAHRTIIRAAPEAVVVQNTDTITPAPERGERQSPITDAFLNTGSRIREGDYIGAFNGVVDAITEGGMGFGHGKPRIETSRNGRTFASRPVDASKAERKAFNRAVRAERKAFNRAVRAENRAYKSMARAARSIEGSAEFLLGRKMTPDTDGAPVTPADVNHALWFLPILGALKMGKGKRTDALALLHKLRPDLDGMKAEEVIVTLEDEFSDSKSQKIALQWVARKGANLPDDLANIKTALEVASKVRGVDATQKSPMEFLSNPQYAKFLPKPDPKNVKAFSNMKRYPEGVIGFDVKDDAEGRQATREMINAYMSPSSNPWCLASGNGAGKLKDSAEGYWNKYTAVPKQIFFQNVDGHLELLAFRATGRGAEGWQEYWDTSDAPHAGIPLKQKIPGDPLGRYRMMEFKPGEKDHKFEIPVHLSHGNYTFRYSTESEVEQDIRRFERRMNDPSASPELRADKKTAHDTVQAALEEYRKTRPSNTEVKGTFQDITPGKIYSGDVFRDGVSKVWTIGKNDSPLPPRMERTTGQVLPFEFNTWGLPPTSSEIKDTLSSARELRRVQESMPLPEGATEEDRRFALKDTDAIIKQAEDWLAKEFGDRSVLTEERERSTKDGISTIVTKKYSSPEDWDYGTDKTGKPYEIEESRVLNPNLLRELGYDPDSEADMRRAVSEMSIAGWGEGLHTVPVKKTTFTSQKTSRLNTDENGRINDRRLQDFVVNGRVFLDMDEVQRAYEFGEISQKAYDKAKGIAIEGMKSEQLPDRLVTTVTFDKFGKHKVTEDVAVEGGDPVSRRKFNPLIPDEGMYIYAWYAYVPQDGETSYEVFDKDSRAFRKVRSTEYARDEHVSEWDPRDRYITTVYDNAGNPTERFIASEDVTGVYLYERNQSLLQRFENGEWVRSISYKNKPRSNMFYEGSKLLPPPSEEIMPEPPPPAATHLDYDPFDIDGFPDLKGGDAGTRAAQKGGDVDYTAHDESTGPTDEQLQEAVEFLETVMEIGAPQNEWEQSIVQRTHDILKASIGMPRKEREPENPAPAQGGTNEDAGGGETDEEKPNEAETVKEEKTELPLNPDGSRGNQEFIDGAKESALESKPDIGLVGKTDIGLVGKTDIGLVGKTDIGLVGKDNSMRPHPVTPVKQPNAEQEEVEAERKTVLAHNEDGSMDWHGKHLSAQKVNLFEQRAEKQGISLNDYLKSRSYGTYVSSNNSWSDQDSEEEDNAKKTVLAHNNDGSMDWHGKHLSSQKVSLFEQRAEKKGVSLEDYLGTRSYGRQV